MLLRPASDRSSYQDFAVSACNPFIGISTVLTDILQPLELSVAFNSTSGSSFVDLFCTAPGISHTGILLSSVLHSSDISRKFCSTLGWFVRRESYSFELVAVVY